jgi:hypothetical protein
MKRLDLFYSLSILTQLVTETTDQLPKLQISFVVRDGEPISARTD